MPAWSGRSLSHKAKGSNNRTKARLRVARAYGRVADRRRDHLHTLSSRIVRENQVVVIEDLTVRNMVTNHCLAWTISDAGWREFRAIMEYQCRWYGRTLVVIVKQESPAFRRGSINRF